MIKVECVVVKFYFAVTIDRSRRAPGVPGKRNMGIMETRLSPPGNAPLDSGGAPLGSFEGQEYPRSYGDVVRSLGPVAAVDLTFLIHKILVIDGTRGVGMRNERIFLLHECSAGATVLHRRNCVYDKTFC